MKCAKAGCGRDAAGNSNYCSDHQLSSIGVVAKKADRDSMRRYTRDSAMPSDSSDPNKKSRPSKKG